MVISNLMIVNVMKQLFQKHKLLGGDTCMALLGHVLKCT